MVNVTRMRSRSHRVTECTVLFQALDRELRAGKRQVSSMQELSTHLLLETSCGEDSVEAKEKVHVISNKLRLLLRQVAGDLLILQGRLVRQLGRQRAANVIFSRGKK